MKIDWLVLGSYETNCYILTKTADASDCLIIDTGLEPKPLLDHLQKNQLNPLAVIFTHGHADHISGVKPLRQNYPQIKVCVHKADAGMFTNPAENLSALAGAKFTSEPADMIIESEGPIEFADIQLDVLHTPGHTPGGICLYSKADKLVFTGDTLFAESVGRTDFGNNPEKDSQQLIESIREKLLTLPDQTVCLPGHGPKTTIQNEKRSNPFLQSIPG